LQFNIIAKTNRPRNFKTNHPFSERRAHTECYPPTLSTANLT
jgi:hypothetical protein